MKFSRAARRWQLRRPGSSTVAPPARTDRVPARTRRTASRTAAGAAAGRRGLRVAAPYLLVTAVVGLAGTGAWLLLASPVLGVRTVTVSGEYTISAGDVARAAAIPVGTPLSRLDTGGAAARVGRLAPVDRVRVTRKWPNTVAIAVTERVPVAVTPRGRNWVLLDHDGVPFRTVPARTGTVAALPVLRVRSARAGDPATEAALTVADALTPALRQLRAEVVATSDQAPLTIEVRLADHRTVFWGDSRDSPRKAKITTALLGQSGTRIDVSAPDVATVR
jgi:cell division protein FtsQ